MKEFQFTPEFLERLSTFKYTRGWAESLTEDDLFALLWAVGEFGVRATGFRNAPLSTTPDLTDDCLANARMKVALQLLSQMVAGNKDVPKVIGDRFLKAKHDPFNYQNHRKNHVHFGHLESAGLQEMGVILSVVKPLAMRYEQLTGKPLGITAEVAEYEAASRLGLELCEARQEGYDALKKNKKIQIKGKTIGDKNENTYRLGSINIEKEWDSVLVVLMDKAFIPFAMYEAKRLQVIEAIKKPGSKARNKRGALSVGQFKKIADCIWKRD